jgi:PAT family beta-lactamase induction signal transducer AmpG
VPTLVESRFARLLTLGALYFAQGVPWGFIAVGYVVYLSDRGLDAAAVGDAIGLAYVPWSFKILAGPLIDRFPSVRFGRRRHFIVGAQLMMGLSLLALLGVDAGRLGVVGAILFAHNAFAAMQDVATDALAVDVLPSEERGKANSIMWAAKNAGVAVGGGGGTIIAKHFGWSTLFVLNALLIWIVMALVIAVRERPQVRVASETPYRGEAGGGALRPADPGPRLAWSEIKRSFSFATPILGIAVAMLAPVGYALIGTVFTRLMRADLGLSEERIAIIAGTVDPVCGVLGALLGGFLADRLGVRKAMGGAMALIGVCLAGFALTPEHWPNFTFLVVYSIIGTSAVAAFNAASLGFFMTLSNPAIGATQFALYMAATNLTYAWTQPLGGRIADRFGAPATFAVAAVAQIAAIGLLLLVDPRKAEARFRAPQEAPVGGSAPPTAGAPAPAG